MSSFIKALATLLSDREELNINVKKIGNDLVVFSTPGKDTKRAVKQVTIPEAELQQEDLDSKIIGEIGSRPDTSTAGYQASALPSDTKSSGNKKSAKKTVAKKPDKKPAKKAAPVVRRPAKKAAAKKQDKKAAPAVSKKAETVSQTEENLSESSEPVSQNAENVLASAQPETLPGASGVETKEPPSPKDVFDSVMKAAEKHAAAKNWQDAEDAYLKALQLEPENAAAKAGADRSRKWLEAYARAEG